MHRYIDITKLRNFKSKKTYMDIEKDIVEKYKITNIYDDFEKESLYYICDALHEDYILEIANYESYIEEGMNARMLMELRKSAILPMSEELYDFYEMHKSCETCQDVKKLRADYLKFLNSDYEDLDWQYFILMIHYLGKKAKKMFFDYEECFEDGDCSKQTCYEDYVRGFVEAHVPKDTY